MTESLSGKAEGKEVPVPFMHWGLVAKTMNAYFKAYETEFVDRAVAEDTPAEPLDVMSKKFGQEFELTMKTAIEADPSKIFTVSGRSQVVGELLGRLAPMLEKMIHQEQGNEDGRTQTLRVALALERYKLETKSYPDSLDVLELRELEPALSLQYEKTETGYLLTSGETEIQR